MIDCLRMDVVRGAFAVPVIRVGLCIFHGLRPLLLTTAINGELGAGQSTGALVDVLVVCIGYGLLTGVSERFLVGLKTHTRITAFDVWFVVDVICA